MISKLFAVLSKWFTCPTNLFAFVLAAHAVAKVPLVKSVPQATPKKIEIEFALSLSNAPVVSAG